MNKSANNIYNLTAVFALAPLTGDTITFDIGQDNRQCRLKRLFFDFDFEDIVNLVRIPQEQNQTQSISLNIGVTALTPPCNAFQNIVVPVGGTFTTGQQSFIINRTSNLEFDGFIFTNILNCSIFAYNYDPVNTITHYYSVIMEIEML